MKYENKIFLRAFYIMIVTPYLRLYIRILYIVNALICRDCHILE